MTIQSGFHNGGRNKSCMVAYESDRKESFDCIKRGLDIKNISYRCYRTCSVRIGEILVEFFFASFMDRPNSRSINLQNKNSTNISPIRTEQASSIKFLLKCFFKHFNKFNASILD